jgi:hypothetical protein
MPTLVKLLPLQSDEEETLWWSKATELAEPIIQGVFDRLDKITIAGHAL